MTGMDTPTPLPPYRDAFLESSEHSRGVALALGVVLGVFGGHRFYVGRPRSGALMALTLGGCGLWYLYDLIVIGAGEFRDGKGHVVTEWKPGHAYQDLGRAELLGEMDSLRAEVAELSERVAFTERLLSAPRPTEEPRDR
jgi:hypothetical protein